MKDIKQCLGKRIRELRKRQGYTQESLAEKIGLLDSCDRSREVVLA